MESLHLPKNFKFLEEDGNKSVFVLEPCYPGYGVTIGNAIRRIMLSSLPGAAVTSVKIKGVDHEFSTLSGVREDAVEIILNLKQLAIKSHSSEPVRLTLKAKGDKAVTAGMIQKHDQIEVINPDLHIATLDGKGADFEMELIVEQGRGYVPVEAREDEKMEIGMVAIDAIYTPIKNVNFLVQNMRVGKMTNYDKLTLYITTNGTISGREALDDSAKIAVEHFKLLLRENFEKEPVETNVSVDEDAGSAPVAAKQEPVEENAGEIKNDLLSLNFSKRSYNALLKNQITTLEQLKALTEEDLKNFRGLGEKSVSEILEAIRSLV